MHHACQLSLTFAFAQLVGVCQLGLAIGHLSSFVWECGLVGRAYSKASQGL